MEDVGIKRLTNMTSGESFDSNAVEANLVCMEIIMPDLVALAIPEKQPGAYTPVKLDIVISNNTSTYVPIGIIGTLIPKLVESNGEELQWREPRERQLRKNNSACSFIKPGERIAFSLEARLSWGNSVLQLQIPDSPEYNWQAPLSSENYWSSAALNSGIYQLQFIYDSPTELICLDSETEQHSRVEAIGTEQLATRFINLSLVQAAETNRHAVEVDGIRFETVMPKRVLQRFALL